MGDAGGGTVVESAKPAPAIRVEGLNSSSEVDEEFDDTDYILIGHDEGLFIIIIYCLFIVYLYRFLRCSS